jgi:hypothetical protein
MNAHARDALVMDFEQLIGYLSMAAYETSHSYGAFCPN